MFYSGSDSLLQLEKYRLNSEEVVLLLEYWSEFLRAGEPKVNIGIGMFRNVFVQRKMHKTGE